jgi:hypothetical protein
MRNLVHWKPKVARRWLLLLAGIIWMAVGIMLAIFAYTWLRPLPLGAALPFALAGLLIAVGGYRLGFVTLAARNILRIKSLPDRAWVFAFQAGKGYAMITMMAASGALLRHSAFPKPYLAVIYLGMGGCLFLSSLLYYPQAWALFELPA